MIDLDNLSRNIVNDSRILQEGDIFVLEKKGLDFLPQILAKKPAKIIAWHDIADHVKTDIEVIRYSSQDEIIELLKSYYKIPKNIWAITGTNGKTSSASFISQMWNLFGISNINIGTMGIITSNNCNIDVEIDNTTPSVFNFYRILHQAKQSGIEHVIFEASSHGLHQGRIDGIEVNMAGITNITQDHLDYHKNMEEYLDAKTLLFDKYLNGTAIINSDVPEFSNIALDKKIIDYGFNAKSVKIVNSKFIDGSFDTELLINGKYFRVLFPVVALFQVYNICATIAFFIAGGFDYEQVINNIPKLKSPVGRMEKISDLIFVDYAHTPDALQKSLESLKVSFTKIVVVFGCGGDRDKTKRPIMGNIAAKLADIVIITDDNPRTEDAAQIRKEIIGKNASFIEIVDRTEAIKHAIKNYPDFCILIAGKGHESYQIIGTEKHYFSDQEEVRTNLKKLIFHP